MKIQSSDGNEEKMETFGELNDGDSFVHEGKVMMKMDGGYNGGDKVNAVVLSTGETWIMDDKDTIEEINCHKVVAV